MVITPSCEPTETIRSISWDYEQYYIGDKDDVGRRHGVGEHHWSSAETLEWYTGQFIRDAMHGVGEYRWRFKGHDGVFLTYEGHFYANRMHGYGTMSYQNGTIFRGLFCNNHRWGPGVETSISRREDVGFWRGRQLIRLAWKPSTLPVAPDFLNSNTGVHFVEQHRATLGSYVEIVGETNSALDLLKHYGADPVIAATHWELLYPKYCTDVYSPLFYKDSFNRAYYNNKIHFLKEVDTSTISVDDQNTIGSDTTEDTKMYFAWNNNSVIIEQMKHCYKHEKQRMALSIDLTAITSGNRRLFKGPGRHELDCRTFLMACYLGQIATVTQMVNDCNIHPDVTDAQGNSALMYAVCGDQVDVINFLVEAGANVDSYNDSCCTLLAVAMMRYVAVAREITSLGIVTAMLPEGAYQPDQRLTDWNIIRNTQPPGTTTGALTKTGSKFNTRTGTSKTIDKIEQQKSVEEIDMDTEITDDKILFKKTAADFEARVNMVMFEIGNGTPAAYLFEANDMVKEVNSLEEEQKKGAPQLPKKNVSKVLKETLKPSKEAVVQGELASLDSIEVAKQERMTRIKATIMKLLELGADPRLVICPQTALCMAVISGSSDLIKCVVEKGVNVNEVYPQIFNYTPLDLAVSRPLSFEYIYVVKTLLECGALANRRLQGPSFVSDQNLEDEPGPTLLHAVIIKKSDGEIDEEVRNCLLELLLTYGCDANAQYKERSALEVVLTKHIHLLDIFIKNPKTDLNGTINSMNQSLLVKMFSVPFCTTVEVNMRLQILTNLLLYGADAFKECQNGDENYGNIFVFANKTLEEIENMGVSKSSAGAKSELKGKKSEIKKPDEKGKADGSKSIGKLGAVDNLGDYKQAVDVVTECARMLKIRWIQAKLMKDLVKIIDRYKHRAWHLIMKEHKQQKQVGLWLTPQRCLEIWEILKSDRRRIYQDNNLHKMLLYIVQYYNVKHHLGPKLTFQDKERIESDIRDLLHENSVASNMSYDNIRMIRPYVKPELGSKHDKKYNVCFECLLPLHTGSLQCEWCKLISFCDRECMRVNVQRMNCHPCSHFLKDKYFVTPEDSSSQLNVTNYN